ncbi:MAG: GyrI-like domain-containing protein [Alphaproteobacteria bacterium]|nr:GyrI-like domain-containing protein [Alphaproteobacteria bacterium]
MHGLRLFRWRELVLKPALGLIVPLMLAGAAAAQPATPSAPPAGAPAGPSSGPSSSPTSSPPAASPATPQAAQPGQETPPGGDAQAGAGTETPSSEQTVVEVDLPARPVLSLRGKSKWDDGFEAITGAFGKLRAEARRLEIGEGGKPLTMFIESDDNGFTFEAMLPLAAEPGSKQAGDGFSFGRNPGGKAMKFEHRGAYAEIEVTYEAITAYLDEKGLLAEDAFIEEYLTEPKSAEDTNLSVDIYVFLKK